MVNTGFPALDEWRANRYALFNSKIDHFKDHPRYEWLRQFSDEAIFYNEGSGYYAIKAESFIERIEQMPLDYIRDWLDRKNQLEWRNEQT